MGAVEVMEEEKKARHRERDRARYHRNKERPVNDVEGGASYALTLSNGRWGSWD